MVRTICEWGRDPVAFVDWFDHAQASMIALNAVCRLHLLDRLGDEPRTAAELAQEARLDSGQLSRLLAFLASQGVLHTDAAGRYAHTDFSRMLRVDHPASLQPIIAVSEHLMSAALALPQAMETGVSAQQAAHGRSFFEMLGGDPGKAETFSRFMTATTALAEQFIFTRHSFAPFDLAVDVGGNHGSLLVRLLAEHPQARGILFDLPVVVAKARPVIDAHPSGPRIETIGGSFFEDLPAGGDLYLLKQVLHDWEDEQCLTILRGIRAVIAPGGRLAVIDRLMPETPRPHPAYQMDLYMMMLLGAKERKLSEFHALFGQSGFRLERVSEDPNVPCVMEAVPV